jgi:predicted secreted protein
MDLVGGLAVYFILWWLVLFAVLPWGVRNTDETGEEAAPGTMPGAPVKAMMWRKLLATTIVSGIIFAILWWLFDSGILSLDEFYRRE